MFFWVSPRRQIVVCRRFETLCQFHLQRLDVEYEELVEYFRSDRNKFLSRLLIMDEIWLYHYDPETKQQSMEWRHSGSPRPKKFQVQKSAGKFLASIFFYQDGITILLIYYLPKDRTINAEYYSSLPVQFKDI